LPPADFFIDLSETTPDTPREIEKMAAPMELVCRGSDVRALKGFIAAALAGVELTFAPMIKGSEGYGGSQVVLDPKGLQLSDANAIARYLGRVITPGSSPPNPPAGSPRRG
jgi:hypothetical protein